MCDPRNVCGLNPAVDKPLFVECFLPARVVKAALLPHAQVEGSTPDPSFFFFWTKLSDCLSVLSHRANIALKKGKKLVE